MTEDAEEVEALRRAGACGVSELCSHTLSCGDQVLSSWGMIVGVAMRLLYFVFVQLGG